MPIVIVLRNNKQDCSIYPKQSISPFYVESNEATFKANTNLFKIRMKAS